MVICADFLEQANKNLVSAVKRSRLTELSIASNRFGIQGAPSLGSLLRGGPEHDDDSDNISVLGEKEGYRTVMYDTSIRSKRRPFAKLEVLDLSNNDLGVLSILSKSS